ncbi:MAG: glycosyltransferase [Actinobacteria bacterium]|nr:glycosyltransferase [Actinomycetota bacterium]
MRRVHVLAWRDYDDPDAGGSELHAHEFMHRFADAGLDVLHRTSSAVGLAPTQTRSGYSVVRRGSRYSVFPRTVASELTHRMGGYDALVEIWNGVPWLSPLWCRKPRIMFLHHVHGPMWGQLLPGPLAAAGRIMETRLAPPLYRGTRTLTPSEATRAELLHLGFPPDHVTAVNNGVDPFFQPGGLPSKDPLVVAVGRLAPVKRFDRLIEAAVVARRRVPTMRLVIVGEGPEKLRLEEMVRTHDASSWITLAGHLKREDLRAMYQQAWVVSSASLAEGWGLTLTEAAACGVPAVATNISGHRCSVVDGRTGVLAELEQLGDVLADVLLDDARRRQLGGDALERARTLTWDASALGVIRGLHGEVLRSKQRKATRYPTARHA